MLHLCFFGEQIMLDKESPKKAHDGCGSSKILLE